MMQRISRWREYLHASPAAPWLVPLAQWLLLAVVGGWAIFSNPFGLGSASERASEQAIYRLTANWYNSEPGHRSIVVVLFNDRSIDNLYPALWQANDWPLSYLDQSNLISQIMVQQPAAIFYDVMWVKQRAQDPGFERAMAKLERTQQLTGVPLFLAQGTADARIDASLAKRLQTFAEPVVNGWESVGDLYPLSSNGQPTAAMALYQRYCQLHGCDDNGGRFSAPMSVRWSAIAAPELFGHRAGECRQPYSGAIAAVAELVAKVAAEMFQGLLPDKPGKPVCAPQRVIYADELLALARSPDPQQRARLSEWLGGALVLVGGQIDGVHDYVTSPVHGSLPGVFFHAMALDNLLAMGTSYIRETDSAKSWQWLMWALFAALLIGLRQYSAKRQKLRRWLANYWLVSGCYVALMLGVSFGAMHLAPSSWLSLLALGWLSMTLLDHVDEAGAGRADAPPLGLAASDGEKMDDQEQ